MMRKALFGIICLFLLGGCASEVKDTGDGVQDIKPGEKSVITAPSRQQAPAGIEERDI